jgi:succinyl-diaminopimelate desuccinylase
MGKIDERVEIEEFLHIVRTHTLSAYDYLTR